MSKEIQISSKYLYVELWAGDVELLCGQNPLVTGPVLQDHCQVDDVVPHHVLVLGREDLIGQNLDCKERAERGSE